MIPIFRLIADLNAVINAADENVELSVESNVAYGNLATTTVPVYDYAPLTITSDLSTTTQNPAYDNVDYTYANEDLHSRKEDDVTKTGVAKQFHSDLVVGQNAAYMVQLKSLVSTMTPQYPPGRTWPTPL